MKKIFTLLLLSSLFFGGYVLAQNFGNERLGTIATKANLGSGNLETRVGGIISAILGLLGTIFLVLTIYAGILWMTASGEEEKVKKAKEILKAAIIGLAIVISAYTITYFVGSKLGGSLPAGDNYYYSCELIGNCSGEGGGTTVEGTKCSSGGCASGEVCCAVKK